MSDPRISQQEGDPEGVPAAGAEASAGEAPLVRTAIRPKRPPVAPWIVASMADLVGLGLVVGVQEVWTLFAAAGLHLAALLPIAFMRTLSSSEKALAGSFVFAFPVLGAPLAVLALEHGNGDLASDLLQAPTAPPDAGTTDFGRLAVALPSCEALTAGTVEERRAIIATLVRRGDADAVALLRWALGASDPDLAVDAALALEEMTASFDARLAACREALAAAQGAPADTAAPTALPSPTLPASEAALAAAELITHAIDVGVADPALVPALASEARDDYALAGADGTQADAVAIGRTQLELGALRPDTALACIDAALPAAGPEIRPVLLSLREEALLASHALPWEGPSARASYQVRAWSHARRPPPLTARRRLGNLPPPLSASIRVGPVQVPGAAATRKVRHVGRE
jgi:hypothetical protein